MNKVYKALGAKSSKVNHSEHCVICYLQSIPLIALKISCCFTVSSLTSCSDNPITKERKFLGKILC